MRHWKQNKNAGLSSVNQYTSQDSVPYKYINLRREDGKGTVCQSYNTKIHVVSTRIKNGIGRYDNKTWDFICLSNYLLPTQQI